MANVLIIDDDPLVRRVVARILSAAGHRSVEAEHGGKGMEAFRLNPPDLVILDLIMPEHEGIGTIARIREISQVPIVAISGSLRSPTFDPLLDARLMGADLTLAKPFTSGELAAAVATLLPSSKGEGGAT